MSLFLNQDTSNFRSARLRRMANSLRWRQRYQNSEIYDLLLDDGRCISLQQISGGEAKGLGTGAFVWPAAHVLAKYLEKRFDKGMKSLYVVDIGSGTGCTGLAAAMLGANTVLTDQQCILDLTYRNMMKMCQDNHISSSLVKTYEYNWGESVAHLNPPFDIILVSDCILPKLYPIEPLVKVR